MNTIITVTAKEVSDAKNLVTRHENQQKAYKIAKQKIKTYDSENKLLLGKIRKNKVFHILEGDERIQIGRFDEGIHTYIEYITSIDIHDCFVQTQHIDSTHYDDPHIPYNIVYRELDNDILEKIVLFLEKIKTS